LKADLSTVNTSLNTKLDTSVFNTQIATKADLKINESTFFRKICVIARNEVKSLDSRPKNSTKSSITRPRDKCFYKKRKRDLKRKPVACLVKKDSRIASLAERVDEDLVVAEASSVGGEERL